MGLVSETNVSVERLDKKLLKLGSSEMVQAVKISEVWWCGALSPIYTVFKKLNQNVFFNHFCFISSSSDLIV